MTIDIEKGQANLEDESRLRFSVSLVKQGDRQFYTLTVPSDVLARTCSVSTRREDPEVGFQRSLDVKRAAEIAEYIDAGIGTIPNSIVLSAQPAANLKIVGRGKTLEFTDTPGAFLILDGQHRVYGFAKAKTSLRVPVVIYNGLTRTEEVRLFIDINTKQRPVPPQLLLDIKRLAEMETETEQMLRDVFDNFDQEPSSALYGLTSASESARTKINRVTFNSAVKPLLPLFAGKEGDEIYMILNEYLHAITFEIAKRTNEPVIARPVVFRAFIGFFRSVAQRVSDRHGPHYDRANFHGIIEPVFSNLPMNRLTNPGTSWPRLRDYLDNRLASKLTL